MPEAYETVMGTVDFEETCGRASVNLSREYCFKKDHISSAWFPFDGFGHPCPCPMMESKTTMVFSSQGPWATRTRLVFGVEAG